MRSDGILEKDMKTPEVLKTLNLLYVKDGTSAREEQAFDSRPGLCSTERQGKPIMPEQGCLDEIQRELLYRLGDALENHSQETGNHIRRVAQVSKFLALKAGLNADLAEMIETAAPTHDVGKVGIRDAVLQKPGKLSEDEFEEMKEHASIGFSILGTFDRALINMAATIAHQHHERYDGRGYPAGLKGKEISIEARIVGIADVLDALLSARIYKPAWEEQRAFEYLREQRGQQFDPELVDLVLAHWDAIMALRTASPPRSAIPCGDELDVAATATPCQNSTLATSET